MIFLAVTLGFFAESLREHMSDKRIEREYIISFVEDLKQDTANFSRTIPIAELNLRRIDSYCILCLMLLTQTVVFGFCIT